MSKEKYLGILGLVNALGSIREEVIKATADGHIDRKEALQIFTDLSVALIHEGLQIASGIARSKMDE